MGFFRVSTLRKPGSASETGGGVSFKVVIGGAEEKRTCLPLGSGMDGAGVGVSLVNSKPWKNLSKSGSQPELGFRANLRQNASYFGRKRSKSCGWSRARRPSWNRLKITDVIRSVS